MHVVDLGIGVSPREWPDVVKQYLGWLQQAGVSSSQIVTYDVGCPDGFANPSDIQQAILKFQGSGVTHVTFTRPGA